MRNKFALPLSLVLALTLVSCKGKETADSTKSVEDRTKAPAKIESTSSEKPVVRILNPPAPAPTQISAPGDEAVFPADEFGPIFTVVYSTANDSYWTLTFNIVGKIPDQYKPFDWGTMKTEWALLDVSTGKYLIERTLLKNMGMLMDIPYRSGMTISFQDHETVSKLIAATPKLELVLFLDGLNGSEVRHINLGNYCQSNKNHFHDQANGKEGCNSEVDTGDESTSTNNVYDLSGQLRDAKGELASFTIDEAMTVCEKLGMRLPTVQEAATVLARYNAANILTEREYRDQRGNTDVHNMPLISRYTKITSDYDVTPEHFYYKNKFTDPCDAPAKGSIPLTGLWLASRNVERSSFGSYYATGASAYWSCPWNPGKSSSIAINYDMDKTPRYGVRCLVPRVKNR